MGSNNLKVATDQYLRLAQIEIAMGQPLMASSDSLPQTEIPPNGADARKALRVVMREFIDAGPVLVSFSGGRDSSAVLAVANAVAREHGTDLPIPVIYRYPGDEGADEVEWQELVLRHLGISEKVVLQVTDQQRILGVNAQESMARRGLVWPASVNLQHELFALASGGVLLTGEGGDELFSGRRSAPVAHLCRAMRRGRRPKRSEIRAAVNALRRQQPPSHAEAQRIQAEGAPWLRGRAREELIANFTQDHIEPLRWNRSIRHVAVRRPLARAVYHNMELVARDYGVRLIHPLLAPEFVSAWMGDGGWFGVPDRTTAMRRLFDDVLPDSILARSSKSYFNASRFSDGERHFARKWDGRGLDLAYVDPETLRQTWLTGEIVGASYAALMAAWMASEGLPLEGPQG